MTFDQVLQYKSHWDSKREKETKGSDSFGRDTKLPAKSFDRAPDNGVDVLHPARYVLHSNHKIKIHYLPVPVSNTTTVPSRNAKFPGQQRLREQLTQQVDD